MFKWIPILLLCGLGSCKIDDDEQVYDSLAFVFVSGVNGGSGFYASNGMVITACHVVKDHSMVVLGNMDGEGTVAKKFWCDKNRDIAYIIPQKNIWKDSLDIGILSDGGTTGCIYGKTSCSTVVSRCGIMHGSHDTVRLRFNNSKLGMSGGPCVIEDDGNLYAVGVIHKSVQLEGHEKDLTGWGWTYCASFRGSEIDN
jgi:hypothetical protein